jgi:hypothetical protein
MKKAILIGVWAICLLNMAFFTDIIVNYLIGNERSIYSGATTKVDQFYFSCFMNFICGLVLYTYTSILTDKERV